MDHEHDSQLNRMLLHVGYAKCASSWLQKYVFDPVVGFACPWPTFENRAAQEFVQMQRGPFDAARVRRDFVETLRACDPQGLGVPVISYETLSGEPTRGQFDGFETARRLHAAFPEARVLICVREQVSYAYSAWCEYVRRGGTWGLDRFAPLREPRPGYSSICRPDLLEFGELVAWYAELFGRDRVLCLPIELLSRDAARFLRLLAEFTGVEKILGVKVDHHYAGLGGVTVRFQRILNHLAPRDPLDWADQRRHRVVRRLRDISQRRLPARWQNRAKQRAIRYLREGLGQRFAVSNRKLQAFVSVDLAELGYPVCEQTNPKG